MTRKLAWLYAAIFLTVGLLAFVPGASTGMTHEPGAEGHVMLLGIFQINTTHTIIHLVSASLGILGASISTGAARLYFLAVGCAYGGVTLLALMQGGSVLGMTHMNGADNGIHAFLGLSALAIALVLPAMVPEKAQ